MAVVIPQVTNWSVTPQNGVEGYFTLMNTWIFESTNVINTLNSAIVKINESNTEANAINQNVNTKASEASASATSASNSAATATTKASEASTSATNALASKNAAANSATIATNEANRAKGYAGAIDPAEIERLAIEVALLGGVAHSEYRPMNIGTAGKAGFGIGDIDYAVSGFTRKMTGNYTDESGSWMCFFPISKIRIGHSSSPKYSTYGANTVEIKSLTADEITAKVGTAYTTKANLDLGDGWFIPPNFVDGGFIIKGNWFDKYKGGFENGKLMSKKGLEPIHSHNDSRYGPRFSDVLVAGVSAGSNRYDTAYNVVKSRGTDYCVPPNQFYSYLNLLVQCQRQNATSVNDVAWMDIEPFQPKGNNNYLKDHNDPTVKYNQANSTNAGKSTTGAVVNFEKTTHDGSILGVADINGGMLEIASGFTRTNAKGFLILKKSIALKDLTATTAFDVANFDAINIADVVAGNDGWTCLGNGTNAVFENTVASDRTFNGIPLATGVSVDGTNQFGKDGIYRYLVDYLVPLRCGHWFYTFRAGAGYLYLYDVRTYGFNYVSVRAFKCQYA